MARNLIQFALGWKDDNDKAAEAAKAMEDRECSQNAQEDIQEESRIDKTARVKAEAEARRRQGKMQEKYENTRDDRQNIQERYDAALERRNIPKEPTQKELDEAARPDVPECGWYLGSDSKMHRKGRAD